MDNNVIINRLQSLRKIMSTYKIDAYIIPTNDFHGSEYVGDYFKCREFISGFTGSAGTVIVTKTRVALWTDGRYFLQADMQLAGTTITLNKMGEKGCPSFAEFILQENDKIQSIGFDGRTLSASFVKRLSLNLPQDIKYIFNYDLVGKIWDNRPSISKEPAYLLDVKYTGKNRIDKIKEIRQLMAKQQIDYLLLTSLDDIAWLLNIRGNDVACNPVVLSFVLLGKTDINVYLYDEVLNNEIIKEFNNDNIKLCDYKQIYEDIKNIKKARISLEEAKVNYTLYALLDKSNYIINELNLTTIPKACKNDIEVKNAYLAHIMDGVAVTKFIYWLKHYQNKKELTELDTVAKLLEFRKANSSFKGISFDTIAGYKEHGAIIHYDPTPDTNINLDNKSFLLVDSGGQYFESTTDITRTISLGELTDEEKMAYTAVLQGHLALGDAYFPEGVCGAQLDVLARMPLWRLGLDFNHGTGHGVGSYLNVHEGPQNISRVITRACYNFKEGMITSNEPGIYFEGKFGIRIENLVVCLKQNNGYYHFDNLTLVPYDIEAIDKQMLSNHEIKQIHSYHERVYHALMPYLSKEEKTWLKGIVEAI